MGRGELGLHRRAIQEHEIACSHCTRTQLSPHMETAAHEPMRIRQVASMFVVELKSPAHGRWIIVEECYSWDEARERAKHWQAEWVKYNG